MASRVQQVMVRKSWTQEPEAAGHIVPIVQKQEMNAPVWLFLFVFSSRPKPKEWCHPPLGLIFLLNWFPFKFGDLGVKPRAPCMPRKCSVTDDGGVGGL